MPPCLTEMDLMERLISAQNHPGNINQDIMTFAGFCDDRAELERHVQHCEQVALVWDTSHKRAA